MLRQREFLPANHQYEAVARRKYKFDSCIKKQMRECLKDRGNWYLDFPHGANQALEDRRETLVTEVTTEVWRRDDQLYLLLTERSRQALHAEDVSQQRNQACMLDHVSICQDWFRRHGTPEKF